MRKVLALLALAALATVAVGCGDDAGDAGVGSGDEIQIADAWARSPTQEVGAVYFTVSNDGGQQDRLVGVSTEVAGRAEIHETVEQDGQMEMQPVASVTIPAEQEVRFEPGGYHVMLFDLTEPLEVDSTIALVLEFESAGRIEVEALVKAFLPDEGMDMGAEGPTGSTAAAGMG